MVASTYREYRIINLRKLSATKLHSVDLYQCFLASLYTAGTHYTLIDVRTNPLNEVVYLNLMHESYQTIIPCSLLSRCDSL